MKTNLSAHTVLVAVRVRSETPEEATRKVQQVFDAQRGQWPRGSVEVKNIEKGWKR